MAGAPPTCRRMLNLAMAVVTTVVPWLAAGVHTGHGRIGCGPGPTCRWSDGHDGARAGWCCRDGDVRGYALGVCPSCQYLAAAVAVPGTPVSIVVCADAYVRVSVVVVHPPHRRPLSSRSRGPPPGALS